MSNHDTTFEEAADAACNMRVLAVKAAKSALNASIKASHVDTIEQAWRVYDAKLTEIWAAHDAAIQRASNAREKARRSGGDIHEWSEQTNISRRMTSAVAASA